MQSVLSKKGYYLKNHYHFSSEEVSRVDELYRIWKNLDAEDRNSILPSLFGRMRYLKEFGTEADKEVAERFFMEIEDLIERVEGEMRFRKK